MCYVLYLRVELKEDGRCINLTYEFRSLQLQLSRK